MNSAVAANTQAVAPLFIVLRSNFTVCFSEERATAHTTNPCADAREERQPRWQAA
jgi:hypothetical protein